MVTGSARGIGAAIAEELATAGASVAVCDVDEANASATAERLSGSTGAALIGVGLDIADSASVAAGVAAITAALGPVDTLVNNAGIDVIEPFIQSTEATWDRIIAV